MLISQTDTAGTLYFLPDAQGSTRALAKADGSLGQTYDYDAFGNLQGDYQSGLDTNYLYTGQQYDVISELYSLRARYYDASIGRFLSRDTWAYDYQNPVELNRYVYTANNPATWSDPSGYFVDLSAIKGFVTSAGSRGLEALGRRVGPDFAKGMVAGMLGYTFGYFLAGLVKGYINSQVNLSQLIDAPVNSAGKIAQHNLGALDPYPGWNSLIHEVWASVGLVLNFGWAGLLGGMIEVADRYNIDYNLKVGNTSIILSALQALITTGVLSIANAIVAPAIDAIFSIIPHTGQRGYEELQAWHDEIGSDFLIQLAGAMISGVIAGTTKVAENVLPGGSAAFGSLATKAFIDGVAQLPTALWDEYKEPLPTNL